jgi:GR25 family glycosyltransferase involved in LPS biosynthesis
MEKVDCKMIVYTKSQKRMDNFNKIKEIIPKIELFDAVDGINEFDKYKQIALENNYATQEFIKNCMNLHCGKPRYGVLGCALSHIFILQDFIKNSTNNWILIFEDDLGLNNFNPKIIDYLITNSEKNDSHYVHLFTNPHFYKNQLAQDKVAPNLHKMIKQWHTLAYLIDKKGAQTLLDRMPYKQEVDNEFSHCIDKINALCFLNNIFINKGALSSGHVNSEMGSLLWNINK